MAKKLVKDFLYEKETYSIRGACFKVWKEFGGAFKEKVVDRALGEELKSCGLKVENQKTIDIYYRSKKIACYKPDKIINGRVLLEIKCKPFLTKEDERQFWLYLKGSEYKLGLLINFGPKKLEIKRRIYDKAREKSFRRKSALISAFISLYLMASFLFFKSLVSAQQQEIKFSVAPEIFERTVKRGDELSEKIKIRNNSNAPLPMEVITTNFGSQEESGTITFYEEPPVQGETPLDNKHLTGQGEDNISFNPRKWIEIENPNFILDPGEVEEVGLKINIPEGAEPGGHYAVILFEPKLPSFYFEEGAVKTIPKVGVLFLFSVEVEGIKKVEEPLTIAEFNIPENFHLKRLENLLGSINEALAAKNEEFSIVETSHLPFTLRIKNNDIYHAKIEGKLTIAKTNGKIVGETEIKETTILPHRTRKFPVEFTPNLPEKLKKFLPASISSFISRNFLLGKYQAHLLLTTGDGKIEKNIEFWVFPWKFWLSTGLLVLLILIFVVKYRKRIKSAFLILFRGKNNKIEHIT
jgi:GxxExxY protein